MLLWLRCGLGHGLPWLGGLRRFCSAHYVCTYVYISRSLFFFRFLASVRFPPKLADRFGKIIRPRSRRCFGSKLSPSSAPNVSHSLGENLYEKEMRRPITVLWRSFGYVSRFTIELFALPIVYYIKATTNPPPLLPSTSSAFCFADIAFFLSLCARRASNQNGNHLVNSRGSRSKKESGRVEFWLREFRPWSATIKIRAVVNGEV